MSGLAQEFAVSSDKMASFALDAGIAFMRARMLTSGADLFFSPSPIADAGWNELAANPRERKFYEQFCVRLSALSCIPPTVLERCELTPEERLAAPQAGITTAAVEAMDRLGIPYNATHWPLDAYAGNEDPPPGCKAHNRLVAAG
ncbi:MAG TPA: hypothetical protein VFO38_02220 [Candidatus Saccharimonadales bacterium]|nr:hypothetical protein [Candidatus Saccharimonadales bacterium]